jgi:hypothetical protein
LAGSGRGAPALRLAEPVRDAAVPEGSALRPRAAQKILAVRHPAALNPALVANPMSIDVDWLERLWQNKCIEILAGLLDLKRSPPWSPTFTPCTPLLVVSGGHTVVEEQTRRKFSRILARLLD